LRCCFTPPHSAGAAFDPYALGYQPWPLLAALVPLAGVLWWQRQDVWLIMLAVNLAAYATGAFANLWDVLFDPLLVMLALIIVGRRVVTRVIASRIR
jgi:lipoprotein signal peptidase